MKISLFAFFVSFLPKRLNLYLYIYTYIHIYIYIYIYMYIRIERYISYIIYTPTQTYTS